jgi:hypothetical protein
MVLVPFLFWKGTWFGTVLSDDKVKEYLEQSARPRDTQHALFQISEQMTRGQWELARRWYPSLLPLVTHPVPEVRTTLAWLMGQDTRQADFHQALAALVKDANPLVRRNAALALVHLPMLGDVPNCWHAAAVYRGVAQGGRIAPSAEGRYSVTLERCWPDLRPEVEPSRCVHYCRALFVRSLSRMDHTVTEGQTSSCCRLRCRFGRRLEGHQGARRKTETSELHCRSPHLVNARDNRLGLPSRPSRKEAPG